MKPSIIDMPTQAGIWVLGSVIPGAKYATTLYQGRDACVLYQMLNYYTTAFEVDGWADITPPAARCERWYRKGAQRVMLRWVRMPGQRDRLNTFVDVSTN